jgi:hypothetical protein
MRVPVELLVNLRVFDPEIGTEIEHSDACLQQGRRLFCGNTMW